MDRSHDWLNDTAADWNDVDKVWRFPSGATLQFGYCDAEGDLERYKSAAFHYIAVDELTEWPEAWYAFLFSRLRRDRGDAIPLRMRAATNPDGIGAEWVRQRFGIPEAEIIEAPIEAGDRCFLPARAEDNPSLDLEEYEKSLVQMTGSTSSARYQQLRWGRWVRDGAGLVYAFDRTRNVTDLRVTPEELAAWRFVLAIDYGYADATALAALGWPKHSRTVYVVETRKASKMTPTEAADLVKQWEGRYHFDAIVGDLGGLGKGYAEEARRRHYLPIEAAEKRNKLGYIRLLNGELEARRLLVLPGNDALVNEWLELPWDEHGREAAGFDNHLADAVLYGWRKATAYLEQDPPPVETPEQREARKQLAEEERLARELDDGARKPRGWARAMARR